MSACGQESNNLNWQICVICQTQTKEKLVNPTHVGYEFLGKHIKEFYELGQLPDLNNVLLANLHDLENVFSQNQAVWHKSCYSKYNTTKLNRAKSQGTNSNSRNTPPMTRSAQSTEYNDECIFCEMPSTKAHPLSTVMKKSCNEAILQCAKILKDYKILAKVSERCDLIALEAKYHNKCFTAYKNRKTSAEKEDSSDKKQVYNSALARVIAHIRDKSDQNPSFRLPDLVEIQAKAMKELGCDSTINVSKFKERLLEECCYLTSCDRTGMPSIIKFKEHIDSTVRTVTSVEHDESILLQAANVLRSDLFDGKNTDSSVPKSLLTLIKLIIFGSHGCTRANESDNRVIHFLAELLAFHAIKRRKDSNVQRRRHSKKESETSAPFYLAAKLFAETRKRTLINCTYQLGMSISYQRLQTILTTRANSVCEMYHRDGVVCPPKLNRDVFTTAAVDNIDHNPTSTTAKNSFHGTAITLMQHKMPEDNGVPRPSPPNSTNTDKIMQLPSQYALVLPCFADLSKCTCTRSDICTYVASNTSVPLIEETEWLESTMSEDFKQWAAHHALHDNNSIRHRTDVALLPLFTEQAHTPAMMAHAMDVVLDTTKFINPHQVPVLVRDQPLYALLKQLQFISPEKYGEDKIFIMMGGLHIEMVILKVIGQWLKESGWSEALVEAQITTQGRSDSMLHATNVARTRYAHEVTAAALYSLQKKAYDSYMDGNDAPISFEQWRTEKNALIPQFKFWDVALNLELVLLRFVRSIRSGDFWMYVDSIRKLLPWFFALDHVNYARWLSVHLKDLVNLPKNHPELLKHFEDGKFVAQKSNRKFSGLALDQAHEQMNAIIKGDGGMIGLTEKPDALRKWLIAGPELAEMVQYFEQELLFDGSKNIPDEETTHHSDTVANKKRFMTDVKSLQSTINNLGNPFLEHSLELYNIDSKTVASVEVVDTIFTIEKHGEEQYVTFCDQRLYTYSEKKLLDPIKLNKYPLLSSENKCKKGKSNAKVSGLKNDCSLFSKLYIATCEHRAGDLDTFFAHENQASPPALSSAGNLRSGSKSDLLKVLTSICETSSETNAPDVSVKILDGPALVHMLNPTQCKTFGDYASKIFIPFLSRELGKISRLDIVWDTYNSDSLKNCTREKRGTGNRTRVTASTKIPKGWANFLRENNNKEELFHLLSSYCYSHAFAENKEVNITDGPNVLSKSVRSTQGLAPCNHEEADSRMMVHVADAVSQGYTRIMIRTVDTDVVVLAVASVQQTPQLEEMWVHIGTGKHQQYLCCKEIANALGPQKAKVLPLFHAFTGCDTVSFFNGKGKKSAFEAWNALPSATEGFLAAYDGRIGDAMAIVEKFVVVMYDRSSSVSTVNDCRKQLFTKKDRLLENIPPTHAALHQHFLRAVTQAVHVWGQMSPIQNIPSPSDWGWTKVNERWEPTWTSLPVAAEACMEMIRCRCKKKCAARCKCFQQKLKCTELCACDGTCYT